MLLFFPLPVIQNEVRFCEVKSGRELEILLTKVQISVVPKTIRLLDKKGADHHTAEDIVQEAMLALAINFRKKTYLEQGNLQAYFNTIALNIWRKKCRKAKRLKILPLIENDFDQRPDSDFHGNLPELPDSLLKAIKSLSERKKRILEMYYFEGLTHREIADQICKSRPYVKTTLGRIRKELRKKSKK